jgi:uncharacterized protein YggE
MRRIALATVLLLGAVALAGIARPEGARALDGEAPSAASVTVSGSGSVAAVPSTALVSFGVDTRASTARAALAANAREMRQVIAAVRAAGGENVTTQSVSLSQAFGPNGDPAGFAAANVVTATTDAGRAGALIDAAVGAGATQVSGPSLSVADRRGLYEKALGLAVADARARAETLAESVGRSLGPVTEIVESGSSASEPMLAKADAVTPIEAGSQEILAGVTVTFAMR